MILGNLYRPPRQLVNNVLTFIDDLSEIFSEYGEIEELALIKDRNTGRSKGFAFITFAAGESAEKAFEYSIIVLNINFRKTVNKQY